MSDQLTPYEHIFSYIQQCKGIADQLSFSEYIQAFGYAPDVIIPDFINFFQPDQKDSQSQTLKISRGFILNVLTYYIENYWEQITQSQLYELISSFIKEQVLIQERLVNYQSETMEEITQFVGTYLAADATNLAANLQWIVTINTAYKLQSIKHFCYKIISVPIFQQKKAIFEAALEPIVQILQEAQEFNLLLYLESFSYISRCSSKSSFAESIPALFEASKTPSILPSFIQIMMAFISQTQESDAFQFISVETLFSIFDDMNKTSKITAGQNEIVANSIGKAWYFSFIDLVLNESEEAPQIIEQILAVLEQNPIFWKYCVRSFQMFCVISPDQTITLLNILLSAVSSIFPEESEFTRYDQFDYFSDKLEDLCDFCQYAMLVSNEDATTLFDQYFSSVSLTSDINAAISQTYILLGLLKRGVDYEHYSDVLLGEGQFLQLFELSAEDISQSIQYVLIFLNYLQALSIFEQNHQDTDLTEQNQHLINVFIDLFGLFGDNPSNTVKYFCDTFYKFYSVTKNIPIDGDHYSFMIQTQFPSMQEAVGIAIQRNGEEAMAILSQVLEFYNNMLADESFNKDQVYEKAFAFISSLNSFNFGENTSAAMELFDSFTNPAQQHFSHEQVFTGYIKSIPASCGGYDMILNQTVLDFRTKFIQTIQNVVSSEYYMSPAAVSAFLDLITKIIDSIQLFVPLIDNDLLHQLGLFAFNKIQQLVTTTKCPSIPGHSSENQYKIMPKVIEKLATFIRRYTTELNEKGLQMSTFATDAEAFDQFINTANRTSYKPFHITGSLASLSLEVLKTLQEFDLTPILPLFAFCSDISFDPYDHEYFQSAISISQTIRRVFDICGKNPEAFASWGETLEHDLGSTAAQNLMQQFSEMTGENEHLIFMQVLNTLHITFAEKQGSLF